jgi:hypothetical protein
VLHPSVHQASALFEKVASPISGFDLVSSRMSERHLRNLGRKGRAFRDPM